MFVSLAATTLNAFFPGYFRPDVMAVFRSKLYARNLVVGNSLDIRAEFSWNTSRHPLLNHLICDRAILSAKLFSEGFQSVELANRAD